MHTDHLTLLSSRSPYLIIEQVSVGSLNPSLASLFAATLFKEPLLALPVAANTAAATAAGLLLAIGPETANGGPLLLLGTAGSCAAAAVQLGHVHRAPVGHHATVGLLGPVQLKHIRILIKIPTEKAVLRIRDVHPGFRIRNFSILDPGSASKNLSTDVLTQKMVSKLSEI